MLLAKLAGCGVMWTTSVDGLMTRDLGVAAAVQAEHTLLACRPAESQLRRYLNALSLLITGLLHALVCSAFWVAAELWALTHLFFGIPIILACFAALLGLWCVYLAVIGACGYVRSLYLRLLLGSAVRV